PDATGHHPRRHAVPDAVSDPVADPRGGAAGDRGLRRRRRPPVRAGPGGPRRHGPDRGPPRRAGRDPPARVRPRRRRRPRRGRGQRGRGRHLRAVRAGDAPLRADAAAAGGAVTGGALAHGIGGRQDLPLPFEDALAGAVIALLATFIILAFAWRRSKLRGDERGLALPGWLAGVLDSPAFRWSLRVAGLVVGLWIVVALVAGPEAPVENPAPGALYVVLWVWV